MSKALIVAGNIVDLHAGKIFPGRITVEGERIVSIEEDPGVTATEFILPGFVDAHVHIESSMLIPSEFARLAVVHGTVATVSDPHEIANVCGIAGVEFMIDNGKKVPFKFNFGAPSCVPATIFETAGAAISADDVGLLMQREDILYLSEMMNFPGVLQGDAEVLKKIAAAKKYNKPVDGHAPGLRGNDMKAYIDAGISTDHECFTEEEAIEKLEHGMKILVREGSAAKNFDALVSLIHDHSEMMMFCSDDKHPDSLVEGHINQLCARAVALGIDVFKVLRVACVNPVTHYKLKVGLLRPNDFADFIVVTDLKEFKVVSTYINGNCVAANGTTRIDSVTSGVVNQFAGETRTVQDFTLSISEMAILGSAETVEIPVIEVVDGQLITPRASASLNIGDQLPDVEKDLLTIAVVNRYRVAPVAKAIIRNFGIRRGAIASSVAHDSHNIVAVGADPESIARAVNLVVRNKGGISCIDGADESIIPLPVAGLMSTEDGYIVAEQYSSIDAMAKSLGCTLAAPFMSLSFMALLVIPHLKLSDLGLFDGDTFQFVQFTDHAS